VHFDKYLVERFFKESNVAVLLVFTAFIGLLLLPFIWVCEPSVTSPSAGSIALIMLSGILYMSALLLYLQALQSEEASVVAPFFQAGPLFGYVLAYLVLGETLSGRQMAGGAMIITGALIVSLRFAPANKAGEARHFKARLAMQMLTCGFIMALSGLIFKTFAIKVEFWTTTFWMFVGEAIFGAALLMIAPYRRQFVALLRANTGALLSINGSNEIINLTGGLGSRYALMFAPLSIVQAISSTTTLFVFIFGVVLSLFFPSLSRETLSARDLVQKGVAAIFVAVGVALVTR
jgi:drug/metabolite transporter (DMT)-like permease